MIYARANLRLFLAVPAKLATVTALADMSAKARLSL
jgi:hypothetical protein